MVSVSCAVSFRQACSAPIRGRPAAPCVPGRRSYAVVAEASSAPCVPGGSTIPGVRLGMSSGFWAPLSAESPGHVSGPASGP